MVERGVVEFWFLGEQIAGLAEERAAGLRTVRTTQGPKSSGPAGVSLWANSRR
jgi:hypothetical protein